MPDLGLLLRQFNNTTKSGAIALAYAQTLFKLTRVWGLIAAQSTV